MASPRVPLAALAALLLASCGPRPEQVQPGAPRTVELTGLPASSVQPNGRPVGLFATRPADEPSAARRLTLAFTGDTLVHSPLWAQARRNAAATGGAYDFAPMFTAVAPLLSGADLAVCHLETPIAPVGEELSTFPLYGVPAEVGPALALAGYDRCSTASNHTIDRGVAGVERTVDVLEAAGIEQSGMARTPDEIEPSLFDLHGIPVAHLSYTFSYNGLRLPDGQEWRSALIDPVRIVADASAARAMGARLVIVSMHWGVEGSSTPSQFQRDVAQQVTASGTVDLIIGHHAHVLQPIEQVNGVWVAYGLGNIVSNLTSGGEGRWPEGVRDGAVLQVPVVVGSRGALTVGRPVVEPTWVDIHAGWVVRPVRATLADPAIGPGLRAELERSLARSMAVVGGFVPA